MLSLVFLITKISSILKLMFPFIFKFYFIFLLFNIFLISSIKFHAKSIYFSLFMFSYLYSFIIDITNSKAISDRGSISLYGTKLSTWPLYYYYFSVFLGSLILN